jgi:hypothetical protein
LGKGIDGDGMEQAEKMKWIMTREFMKSTVFQKCVTVGQKCLDLPLLEKMLSRHAKRKCDFQTNEEQFDKVMNMLSKR